jgi:hypothetical protein
MLYGFLVHGRAGEISVGDAGSQMELRLIQLKLETTGANCDPQTLALLHDTRKLYPKCERKTVVRTAKMARGVGQPF